MAARRRGTGCLVLVLILLVVVCGVAVVADRAVASIADDRLTEAVARIAHVLLVPGASW